MKRAVRPTGLTGPAQIRKKSKPPSPAVVFGLGLVSATQVQVIGYLSIVELFFAVLTPYFVVTRWRTLVNSQLQPFLVLLLGWFISALATDFLYRETELNLALKGALTPLLWASALISMYFLLRERIDLIRWFIFGGAISGVIALYIFKPGSMIGLEAKGGGEVEHGFRVLVGVWTTFIWAAVLFLHPHYPRLAVATILAFALLCFAEGSRSAGAVSLLVASLILFGRRFLTTGAIFRRKRRRGRLVVLAAAAVLLVFSISEGYRHAVLEGWLGDTERQRYITQSQSKVGILGGRSEFASAMFAIADSPILGHGSWAKDEKGYRYMGAEALGIDVSGLRDTSEMLIPAHSHLWGPWISHGLLGFAFWFYVLVYVLKFFVHGIPYAHQYLPFALLLGSNALWDILFSPVGFRPLEAAGYAFMIVFLESLRREQALQSRNCRYASLRRPAHSASVASTK